MRGRGRVGELISGAGGGRACVSVFGAGGGRGSGVRGGVCGRVRICGGNESGGGGGSGVCCLVGRRSGGVGECGVRVCGVSGSAGVEGGCLRGGGSGSAGVCASREGGSGGAWVCARSRRVGLIGGGGACGHGAGREGVRESLDGLLVAFGASADVGAILRLLWRGGQYCASRLRGQCCGGSGCWVWVRRRRF